MKKHSGKLKHSKKISAKKVAYSKGILALSLILTMAVTFSSLKTYSKATDPECSNLEKMLGTNGVSSTGYDHGYVYSINGHRISTDVAGVHCAVPGFSSVLGSEDVSGMITNCDETLHSSASNVNTNMRTGNNIVTTLMYAPQLTASRLLKENFSFDSCNRVSVTVLLKDGAVITAAGLNEYDYSNSDEDEKKIDLYVDYTTSNTKTGSVAKTITARTLLCNNDGLSQEDSLYNNDYRDFSKFEANGVTISNWDCNLGCNYETILSGGSIMERSISLEKALILSSNTYFWRHALAYGLENTMSAEKKLFDITTPITTDICTIPGVNFGRPDYFAWGQDFECSPIRLCALYNHILSGESYTPFFVASVHLPNNELIFKATPKRRASLDIDIEDNDILITALGSCFKSYCSNNMSPAVYGKYSKLIEDGRLLSKSGTAEIDVENGITNNVRVLTVLDEDYEVICTAAIVAERCTYNAQITDDKMYSILFQTLEAANIL